VLHFDGQLLAVEDAGELLAKARGEMQVIIVVCREAGRQIGVAVSHVLDVAKGSDLFEAGTTQAANGVTLLKDRVTGIVDLGSVAALPMPEPGAYAESGQ
jgi:two-component system chemotaxis sensor kinase CheA